MASWSGGCVQRAVLYGKSCFFVPRILCTELWGCTGSANCFRSPLAQTHSSSPQPLSSVASQRPVHSCVVTVANGHSLLIYLQEEGAAVLCLWAAVTVGRHMQQLPWFSQGHQDVGHHHLRARPLSLLPPLSHQPSWPRHRLLFFSNYAQRILIYFSYDFLNKILSSLAYYKNTTYNTYITQNMC